MSYKCTHWPFNLANAETSEMVLKTLLVELYYVYYNGQIKKNER